MADYQNLPCRDDAGHFYVVVETPRGSSVKLKYDEEKRVFMLSRTLLLGLSYPYDWGFVPSTQAEDGDPLDAMVLVEGSTSPGVVVACVPLGVVRMTQKEPHANRTRNDRVIALPANDARFRHVKELPERMRDELERFFVTVSEMTQKKVHVQGWDGPATAEKVID